MNYVSWIRGKELITVFVPILENYIRTIVGIEHASETIVDDYMRLGIGKEVTCIYRNTYNIKSFFHRSFNMRSTS